MWKHFEALQGKEESEKPRKPFLKYLFLQSMRLDEFDEELLSLMDRCGNTLKSSKERRKVRSQGNLP
jgi:hypothetical protein